MHSVGTVAMNTGWIAFSQAPVIIIQDGDLEYDPADYAKMLGPIINGCADVVYGSRFNTVKNENPLWHSFGNRCLTWCSNLASGLTLTDEATCYKMFRREVFDMVSLEEDGFGFCPEITAKISKLRVRIVEVPISYSGRTRAQGKKIRLSDGLNAVKCIVKYNFCQRSPKPAHIVSKWTAST
jgi:glycosyltransferase involved in cell wall biosynthesis